MSPKDTFGNKVLQKRSANRVVTCCALWHINIEAMNSDSEWMSVDSDNGNAEESERKMSLWELNRALSSTRLEFEDRKHQRNSVRLANLNEAQREKRRLVQQACYGNRKRKRKELESATGCAGMNRSRQRDELSDMMQDELSYDTSADINGVTPDANAVNHDAERFRSAYDMTTQLHVCAVCGTDECSENVKKLDSDCVAMVEASNLPTLYSTVVNSLCGGEMLYDEYLQNVQTEFHCNGLLKDARYMCLDCYTVLKRGKTVRRKKQQHDVRSNASSGSSSLIGHLGTTDDDEYGDVLHSTQSTNQAMNVPENIPRTAFLHGLYPGIVPDELKDLRPVEVSMISIYNPITRIKLNSKGMSLKYYHGSAHTYTMVNDVSAVASHLPWVPTITTLAIMKYKNEVCVKELKYRPHAIRNALTWLKQHNHLYKSIAIEYPHEWAGLDAECELEPESMVIDEMEATAMREMEDEEEAVSGETSVESGDSPDDTLRMHWFSSVQ